MNYILIQYSFHFSTKYISKTQIKYSTISTEWKESYFPASGPDLWSEKMCTSETSGLMIPRADLIMLYSNWTDTLVEKVVPLIFLTKPSSIQLTACLKEHTYKALKILN